jgi:glycosyltransferase involved in cell wall biosynthesis
MRFHLLSLVHLPQSKTYMSCAFTQKNRKMAKMLTDAGHEVFFYGSEGSDIEEYCNSDKLHFIQTHTLKDIRDDYGTGDNRFEIGYDWTIQDFKHDFDIERKPSTLKFYLNTIKHINKVKKPDDFLLISQGYYYDPIKAGVGLYLNCEFGIGYRGSVKTNFRAFESSYIQNYTYGAEMGIGVCGNGSFYDRVIPNYFDNNDFTYSDKKKDYYLFIGRMISRKGILIAYEAAKALNTKLIIAGQGAKVIDGELIDDEPHEFSLPRGNWEFRSFVGVDERKKLMSEAIATFVPTIYLECFAGTHIESMLSGTPPITTNFGVFPETIPNNLNGKVGFRCNTLQDFVDAGKKAKQVNHLEVRKYGEKYLMDNVWLEFEKWFNDLYQVYKSTDGKQKGWSYIK